MVHRWWHRAFLRRRPSISLSLFRFAVAFTVGCHMIPSFVHMEDNYLATAFKEKNFSFFPLWTLRLVEQSPDGLVWGFVWLFLISLTTFTIGFSTQLSGILLTLSCYYFYALNSFHIGTLSFDILLVTLCLMCATPYPGDFLSIDSLRYGKDRPYRRLRPYFLQRLLQCQLAWTFWYTALSKVTAGGNWLTGNPFFILMRYPPMGVVRDFPLRAWLGQHPALCHGLGVALLIFEGLVPFLWFIPRTRPISITLGWLFQVMLWRTLHVPTIFVWLFPPMMLLFIRPELLVQWIEARQERHAMRGRAMLLYDGQCGFCLANVKRLKILDLFSWLDPLNFHRQPDLSTIHPSLTRERCRSEMVLVESYGRIAGGFDALRRISLHLPLLWWTLPFLYLPGARWVGMRVYRWVALRRFLLHRNPTCATNQCGLPSTGNGSSSKT